MNLHPEGGPSGLVAKVYLLAMNFLSVVLELTVANLHCLLLVAQTASVSVVVFTAP